MHRLQYGSQQKLQELKDGHSLLAAQASQLKFPANVTVGPTRNVLKTVVVDIKSLIWQSQ